MLCSSLVKQVNCWKFSFHENFFASLVSVNHLILIRLGGSLVGLSGLEPPTSRLSGVRSNRLSYKPICPAFRFFPSKAVGGDKRIRTDDPLLAKQVLSQLSYTPVSFDPASIQLFSSYSPEGRALKIKQLLDTPSSLEPRN